MYDFLTSSSGGAWAEKEIVFFPNGVDDAMLAFVLERLKADKAEQILTVLIIYRFRIYIFEKYKGSHYLEFL